MTTTRQPRKHRQRLFTVLTVVAVVAAAIVYVMLQIPKYRTAFLVDASATITADTGADGDLSTITDAVGSAAQNAGNSDALSLRRFGGACGGPDNTTQIVDSGAGRSQQISDAASTLTPSGDATLQSGILAAIDDFSDFYPFQGWKSNRIVVVTSHGTDACTSDQAALMKTIRDHIDAAGLQLDFRFVGYKVPTDQQDTLGQVAAATGAPEPKFVETGADLTATLKELLIPESRDAALIEIPSTSTTPPQEPSQPVLIAVYNALKFDWNVRITTDVAGTEPCFQQAGYDNNDSVCSFVVPQGSVAQLTAEISGTTFTGNGIPGEESGSRTTNGVPVWFGCDEPPMRIRQAADSDPYGLYDPEQDIPNGSLTCTLNLTTGRYVGLGSTDPHSSGGTFGISSAITEISKLLGGQSNRVPIPVGVTKLEDSSVPNASDSFPDVSDSFPDVSDPLGADPSDEGERIYPDPSSSQPSDDRPAGCLTDDYHEWFVASIDPQTKTTTYNLLSDACHSNGLDTSRMVLRKNPEGAFSFSPISCPSPLPSDNTTTCSFSITFEYNPQYPGGFTGEIYIPEYISEVGQSRDDFGHIITLSGY